MIEQQRLDSSRWSCYLSFQLPFDPPILPISLILGKASHILSRIFFGV